MLERSVLRCCQPLLESSGSHLHTKQLTDASSVQSCPATPNGHCIMRHYHRSHCADFILELQRKLRPTQPVGSLHSKQQGQQFLYKARLLANPACLTCLRYIKSLARALSAHRAPMRGHWAETAQARRSAVPSSLSPLQALQPLRRNRARLSRARQPPATRICVRVVTLRAHVLLLPTVPKRKLRLRHRVTPSTPAELAKQLSSSTDASTRGRSFGSLRACATPSGAASLCRCAHITGLCVLQTPFHARPSHTSRHRRLRPRTHGGTSCR